MQGADERPLLLLDRVGEGRVAQLSSDHIWLWSRGYDGGGPHAELLRRMVHWLMKEPELDERTLDVRVHKNTITVQKQNYAKNAEETLAMTTPDGEHNILTLKADGKGLLSHKFEAQQLGVYMFEDTNATRKFAIIGDLDPPELRGVKTTAEMFAPLVTASRGTTIWLDKTPKPTVTVLSQNARRFGGSDWLGLRQNNDYTVTGVKEPPLLPAWVILLTLLSALIALWWREGKRI